MEWPVMSCGHLHSKWTPYRHQEQHPGPIWWRAVNELLVYRDLSCMTLPGKQELKETRGFLALAWPSRSDQPSICYLPTCAPPGPVALLALSPTILTQSTSSAMIGWTAHFLLSPKKGKDVVRPTC